MIADVETEVKRKRSERSKRYYQENKEKVKAKVAEYRAENKERVKELKRKQYADNPEAAKERAKKWATKNPEKAADKLLRFKYGISLDEYNKKLAAQNGLCAICEKPHSGRGKNLHVDHDYETGAVRGLLCQFCNIMLGHAKDSTKIIENAIAYLIESARSIEEQ